MEEKFKAASGENIWYKPGKESRAKPGGGGGGETQSEETRCWKKHEDNGMEEQLRAEDERQTWAMRNGKSTYWWKKDLRSRVHGKLGPARGRGRCG